LTISDKKSILQEWVDLYINLTISDKKSILKKALQGAFLRNVKN